jgi:hypothetical protein
MRAAAPPFQNEESVLVRFGYTSAEAAFVTLATLHGGYFLRRQAAEFFNSKDGGRVTQLVQKTLGLEHASCSTWRQNVQLYHLQARPLYAALGEPDNRNRRHHEWSQIKNRVLRLDFVLAHPNEQFLATESERVEHFQSHGIALEALPSKSYRSALQHASTTRFFVDKFPMFVRDRASGGPPERTVFTFVDEGLIGISKFENYLRTYCSLFERLAHFEIIYVAATTRHFERSRAAFERFVRNGKPDSTSNRPSADQLLEYFRLRKRYEERAFGAFDRAELIRLRDARTRFSSAEHDTLFNTWLTSGDAVLACESKEKSDAAASFRATFSTFHIRHDYTFFGGYGLR